MSDLFHIRTGPNYGARSLELLGESFDYSLKDNTNLFDSVGTKGYRQGIRSNIRIKPASTAIWLKYNSTDEDAIYIAGDEVFEDFNVQARDILLSSAATTTAQIDRWVAAAESSGNYEVAGVGKYFYLYAKDAVTGADTTYGVWFDTDNGSTQPTDSAVDTWVEVDIATSDTADTIGGATATALDALAAFSSTNTTGTVNTTHAENGPRRNAAAGSLGIPGTLSTPTEGDGTDTTVHILVR